MLFDGLASIFFDSKMKFLKCFVYFLTLIILGNFVLTGKEKVLPKAPTPKWSDFKYNSEEEKEFWDKLPDWTTNRAFNTPRTRKNGGGETIDKNSSEGFDGYVKYNSESYRTIYQFVDGYTSRWKSWFKSGKQMGEGKFLKENRDGTWNECYENGQKKSERNYKDGKVSGNAQFWTEDGKPSRFILSLPSLPSRWISTSKKQQE